MPTHPMILQTACQHRTAYIATTLRNEGTLQLFLSQAAALSLNTEDVSSHARQSCVQFQHHLVLQSQRSSVLLHRIELSR